MAVYEHSKSVQVFVLFFFFLTIPLASPLYFNLTSIGPDNQDVKIKTQGDASTSELGLILTPDNKNFAAGRAIYIDALQLWDNASGKVADFYTHFSFVIDSSSSICSGDGLAFFLTPTNHSKSIASGSALGLAYNATVNRTLDPFVAVEFDTYPNTWDPEGPHVGIDINSLISAANMTWKNNFTQGNHQNDAWISYNSTLKKFSVKFTGHAGNKKQKYRLDYFIDLRNYLPELVNFGISAGTGRCSEMHIIKSWEFNSSLEIVSHSPAPAPIMAPNISPNPSFAPFIEPSISPNPSSAPFMGPSISPNPSSALNPGGSFTPPSISPNPSVAVNPGGSSMVPSISPQYSFAGSGKRTKIGLIIGLSVGLSVVLMVSLVFVGHRIWRKKIIKEGTNE